MSRWIGLPAAALAFSVLATANSGGYRYGISDQAFYQPAVVHALQPDLFPRDAPLLEAQTRLMLSDEALAAASGVLGLDLPTLFFGFYVISLLALFGAAVAFANALRLSPWATAAFVALLTLRHRIARTGANTLEGYAHPRTLAFALGLAALACVVRRRPGWALTLVAAAAGLHPTTALWFGLVVAAATVWRRPDRLKIIGAAAVGIGAVFAWAVIAGPLAGRLALMDPEWLAVLEQKDYLFPMSWPPYAWAINLSYPAAIVAIHSARRRQGAASEGERDLVIGLLWLLAVFAISLPLTSWKLALAVQLQVTRVFWLQDVVATALVAWWLMASVAPRARVVVAALVVTLSIGRGIFVMSVDGPPRALVQVNLPASAWTDVMRWLGTQPTSWHVLADPDHGWKQGLSVRVGALRDTLVESGKDTALAMYDRDIAVRVAGRLAALSAFDAIDLPRLRALRERYAVDVLVIEADRTFDLPVLYRNDRFVVYDLR